LKRAHALLWGDLKGKWDIVDKSRFEVKKTCVKFGPSCVLFLYPTFKVECCCEREYTIHFLFFKINVGDVFYEI